MKNLQSAKSLQTCEKVPFEVYVHVPFCLRRCGYCDFNTYAVRGSRFGTILENYADEAIREMELVKKWQDECSISEPCASSVFFGGGTPSILSAEDLIRMLEAVKRLWGLQKDAEITTEANPDTADDDFIRKLANGGFTRISFGMQSALPSVLAVLDRTHKPENVFRSVKTAEKCGLRTSVDLIYGAPGESLNDWEMSVRAAIGTGVKHISAYALTVSDSCKMGKLIAAGKLERIDEDLQAEKYALADSLFSQAGFEWYEVSNWAVKGFESKHNTGYWRNVDWAGIGPGAHSHYALADDYDFAAIKRMSEASLSEANLSETDSAELNASEKSVSEKNASEEFSSLRAWDLLHPKKWAEKINQNKIPWEGGEYIDSASENEEKIMLSVRTREGLAIDDLKKMVSNSDFEGVINAAKPDKIGELVSSLEKDGLSTVQNGRIVATLRGRLLNDAIIRRILNVAE